MSHEKREWALQLIEKNIRDHGFHIYLVQQSRVPRFAYTVGLTDSQRPELVLAGAIRYDADEVLRIVTGIATRIRAGSSASSEFALETLGSFSLRAADPSWTRHLMLGASDYYHNSSYEAVQVVPNESHWTLDIPDLGASGGPSSDSVWRWLTDEWPYEVPSDSIVVTNMKFLQAARATEVTRWEECEWELFAGPGPDVAPDEMRVIPIGTALGIDASLEWMLSLGVGRAGWRDDRDGAWQAWKRKDEHH